MSNEKNTVEVTTIGGVKAAVKALLDAEVLDPKMSFLAVNCSGRYPVVLLHKNIKKFFRTLEESGADPSQVDIVCKDMLRYNIDWLMEQDDMMPLRDKDGSIVGTPVLRIVNCMYSSQEESKADPDSMRIDIVAPIEIGDKISLKRWPEIDGYVISSMTKRQVYVIFGSTSKMLKLNALEEENQDEEKQD